MADFSRLLRRGKIRRRPNEMDAHSLRISQSASGRGENDPAVGECAPAIAELAHTHWDSVYRLTYRLSNSAHEAEDLTQETFLRALDRRQTFVAGTNLRAWLMRIATNLFLDARRRRIALAIQPLADDPPRDQPGVADAIEKTELNDLLTAAIAELPEHPRIVLVLRTEQDLSFREIGEILAISEETARWHMLQARRTLMQRLEGKI